MIVWRGLLYVVNKLWLVLAILLVALALLLSAARMALPHLENYRLSIEQTILKQYGQEVKIGALNAKWTHQGPTLVLEKVTLATDKNVPFALELGEIQVALSFWHTVWNRQLVFEEFVLNDLVVDLYQQENNSQDFPLIDALEKLLLQQLEHFEIKNSTLNFYTLDGRMSTIRIEGLRWLNRDGTRQATGRFSIPDVTANHLNFIAEFDSKSARAVTGSLYVEASRLDISPWLTQFIQTADLDRAEFNLRGWVDFDQMQFVSGQVDFGTNHFAWRHDESAHSLTTNPTRWLLTPQEQGWLMNSEPLTVHLDEQTWQIAEVAWEYKAGEHLWNLAELELGDFGPVWSLFGSPGEEVRAWSAGLQPSGHITAFKTKLTAAHEWQFYVAARDLSWQPYRGIPGISGLGFEFWSTAERGRFELAGHEVFLESPSTFSAPQILTELRWLGFWERDQEGWSLRLPNAQFNLPKAELIQDFRVSGGKNKEPIVEWSVGTVSHGMLALDTLALLPLQVGEELAQYLHEAIQAGVLDELSMAWRGSLANFPYRAGEGIFQAQAILSDLNFQFQPDWLPLTTAQAVLHYDNETLTISAVEAQIGAVTATQVQAQLPDLLSSQRWLHVYAQVAGEATAAQQVFQQSPLAPSIGAALEQVVLSGAVQGEFRLSVPFFAAAEVQVKGEVEVLPQQVHLAAIHTDLTDLSGVLRFNNTYLEFKPHTAYWQSLPLKFQVTGNLFAEGYQLQAEVAGAWPMTSMQDAFPSVPLFEHFRGELASRANFELWLDGESGFTYQWDMRTDLTAIEGNLPPPFVKAPGEMWFWDTQVIGNEHELLIHSALADKLQFTGQLMLGAEQLQAALLQIGGHSAELPKQGMTLQFIGEQLALAPWLEHWLAWEEQVAQLPANQVSEFNLRAYLPEVSRIKLAAEQLDVWGQVFTSVEADLQKQVGHWQGELNADQTRMTLAYSEQSDAQAIHADFLELTAWQWPLTTRVDTVTVAELTANAVDAESKVLVESVAVDQEAPVAQMPTSQTLASNWLEQIPPLDFICRICRYDNKDLGRVTFALDRRLEGEQLRHFRILKTGTRLELKGGWQGEPEQLTSSLTGTFNTKNVSSLLQEWGADSVVRDSELNVTGQLQWVGPLLGFNRASLNGELQYHLGAGYLRNVSDGGARLLSVLSLDSIVRKLTLDFRDIFARGLFFSNFSGDLSVEQALVSTQNTEMIGAAGDLSVKGTTHLLTEQVDYQLTYTPKVTSSLPVLLAWMVNPPSGLAALVIDRVLHDAKVISRLQYQITGTMSEPVVTEVRRDAKTIDLPEEELRQQLEQTPVEENNLAQGEGNG